MLAIHISGLLSLLDGSSYASKIIILVMKMVVISRGYIKRINA